MAVKANSERRDTTIFCVMCIVCCLRQGNFQHLRTDGKSGARANARSAVKFFGLNLRMNGSGLRFIHSALPC